MVGDTAREYNLIFNMADNQVGVVSELNQNNYCNPFDSDKISEHISLKNVVFDGQRIKWCESYELLKDFLKTAFNQQGKWCLPGGNSKRFEASTSDFTVTWYPGKQNTLTFKGRSGCLAKEYLINLCAVSAPKNIENVVENRVRRHGFDENVGDIMLEIEILKSRFDSLQFLLDSRENPDLHTISKLGSEISLLQIDLEEEKNRNKVLESEVKCLQQEIKTLKQLFNASESRDHLNCKVALTDLITEVEFPDRPLLNQVNEFESPERPKVQSSESLYSIQVIVSESSERPKKQLSPDQSTDQQRLSLLANSANLNED